MTNISSVPSSPFGIPLGPAGTPALTRQRVAQALTRLGVNHGVDEDGDPVAVWEGCVLRFISTGDRLEVLQVRGLWAAQPPTHALPELLPWINLWHSQHRWPMGFFVQLDDRNLVVADVTTDLEFGATDDQLDQLLRCAIGSINGFFDQAAEDFPQHTDWVPAPEGQEA